MTTLKIRGSKFFPQISQIEYIVQVVPVMQVLQVKPNTMHLAPCTLHHEPVHNSLQLLCILNFTLIHFPVFSDLFRFFPVIYCFYVIVFVEICYDVKS